MRSRPPALAAWFASATHVFAGLAMATFMRPGLSAPGVSVEDRMAFLADHPALWGFGWILWHAAGISMVTLYGALVVRWHQRGPIRAAAAAILSAAALAADLCGQSLFLQLPGLDPTLFVTLDHTATHLTAYVANGLYSIAGILIVWTGAKELPRPLVWVSFGIWLPGLGMSPAAALGSSWGLVISSAILMPMLVVWTALLGRWLNRPAA